MTQISAGEIGRHLPKKHKKHISIKESENGGYSVHHHEGEYPSSEDPHHIFEDHEDMLEHVSKHFGGKAKSKHKGKSKEEEEEMTGG